jgi:hypothetical protein
LLKTRGNLPITHLPFGQATAAAGRMIATFR